MSLNYLEIETMVAAASERAMNDEVAQVAFVEMPLPAPGAGDLAVGLRFRRAEAWLVFDFRNPWVGLFWDSGSYWRKVAQPPAWSSEFGSSRDWRGVLEGRRLRSLRQTDGDRVLTLEFDEGVSLTVELFPSRPNFELRDGESASRWRVPLARPVGSRSVIAGVGADRKIEKRDFGNGVAGLSWVGAAHEHYLGLKRTAVLERQIQRGLRELQARVARDHRTRTEMQAQLRESESAAQVKRFAEILKSELYTIPKDWRGVEIVLAGERIPMDPKLSSSENLTELFGRAKKLERTGKEIRARSEGVEERLRSAGTAVAELRALVPDKGPIARASFEERIRALRERFKTSGIPWGDEDAKEAALNKTDKKFAKARERSGLRAVVSGEGLSIWIGRNHKENEELVIRLARGNDLWMHLKGKPGAHAIIQLPGGKSAGLETLLDAATLVAYNSGVREGDKFEVDYAFRKNVKRVPGGKDKFLVTYSQNKTLLVKMDEKRLWRILKQQS